MLEHRSQSYELWPAFDSYIKKVIRSLNNQYGRMKKKQNKEIQVDTHEILTLFDQNSVLQIDQYPVERQTIQMDGKEYPLDDDALFIAVQRLPPQLLQILILKYWKGYKEKEIAAILRISQRACYDRRKKAILMLQRILEENAHGQYDAP